MKFKYNNRIYECYNLDAKLEKMNIGYSDIEVLPEPKRNQNKLYKFKNSKGEELVSLYNDLSDIAQYIDIDDYKMVLQ